LLHWTEGFLRGKGVETPRLDAELLLAHVLGCSRLDLYLQHDRPLGAAELSAYRELVRARAARTPVAYLVGAAGFWKLTLVVRPGCLIPRPDTETLVEATLRAIAALRARLGAEARLAVLELGTGSGAIPLAVCSEAGQLDWLSVELSATALAVARENRARHAALLAPRHNALWLVRGDGFAAVAPGFRPHLVVSNPPYIPSAELPGLMPEVSQAEPRAALDGGPDGMDIHRYLMASASERLAPGGRLLMEMAHNQGAPLSAELARYSLRRLALHKDLAGRERVIEAEQVE
jgi:release factor glutamine methyltransferase